MKKLRYLFTKVYYWFFHQEVLKKLDKIENNDFDLDNIHKYKEEKLDFLLRRILPNIEYYKDFNYNDGLSLLENFKNINILNKFDLVENFQYLKSTNDKDSKSSFINYSGGSSGTPTKFLYDANFMSSFSAWKIYSDSFIQRFPYRILRMWGDQNIALKKKEYKYAIRNYINNISLVNGFNINEKSVRQFIYLLNKNKPDIVECYSDSLYNSVLLLKKLNLKPKHKNFSIITSAGTLYPFMREEIEGFFDVKVHNRYGSREVGPIAMECEHGKIHINEFNLHVEVLNEFYQDCKLGETGKVYVTTLDNYAMPLIRYNQGDMVTLSKQKFCTCGRKSRIIDFVDGRDTTFIFSETNGKISSLFFVHFFGVTYNNGSIDNFQIIQSSKDNLIVKAVIKDREKFILIQSKLENSLRGVIGNNINISWEFVEKIDKLPSGKYQYVINKLIA